MRLTATTHGYGPYAPAIITEAGTLVADTSFSDEAQAYAAADNVRRDVLRGHRPGWRSWVFSRCACAECQPGEFQGTMVPRRV